MGLYDNGAILRALGGTRPTGPDITREQILGHLARGNDLLSRQTLFNNDNPYRGLIYMADQFFGRQSRDYGETLDKEVNQNLTEELKKITPSFRDQFDPAVNDRKRGIETLKGPIINDIPSQPKTLRQEGSKKYNGIGLADIPKDAIAIIYRSNKGNEYELSPLEGGTGDPIIAYRNSNNDIVSVKGKGENKVQGDPIDDVLSEDPVESLFGRYTDINIPTQETPQETPQGVYKSLNNNIKIPVDSARIPPAEPALTANEEYALRAQLSPEQAKEYRQSRTQSFTPKEIETEQGTFYSYPTGDAAFTANPKLVTIQTPAGPISGYVIGTPQGGISTPMALPNSNINTNDVAKTSSNTQNVKEALDPWVDLANEYAVNKQSQIAAGKSRDVQFKELKEVGPNLRDITLPMIGVLGRLIDEPGNYQGIYADQVTAIKQVLDGLGFKEGSADPSLMLRKLAAGSNLDTIKTLGGLGLGRVLSSEVQLIREMNVDPNYSPATNRFINQLNQRIAQRTVGLYEEAMKYAENNNGILDKGWQKYASDYLKDKQILTKNEIEMYKELTKKKSDEPVQNKKAKKVNGKWIIE